MVSVATGANGNVALECRVRDANPPPRIQWFDGNDMPLIEVTNNNLLRFLDNGRYLLIRTLTAAQVNTNYYCSVTNVRLHETMRSPTTYDLDPTLGSNEIMIYKSFVDRTLTLVGGGSGTVQWSYIAGAGTGVMVFGLVSCRRRQTAPTPGQTLILSQVGGVIEETIPRGGDNIPSVAESVTFEVSCPLVGDRLVNTSRATLTVLGRCQGNSMLCSTVVLIPPPPPPPPPHTHTHTHTILHTQSPHKSRCGLLVTWSSWWEGQSLSPVGRPGSPHLK